MFRKDFWNLMDGLNLNDTTRSSSFNWEELKALHQLILENLPQKLYRFQSFNSYTEGNLSGDVLYCNPVSFMNDKQECSCYVDLEKAVEWLSRWNEQKLSDLFSSIRNNDYPGFWDKFGSTVQKEQVEEGNISFCKTFFDYLRLQIQTKGIELVADFLLLLRKMAFSFGIACFTETYESSYMPALYGNNCTGYVIEYDVSDIISELQDTSEWTYLNLGFSALLLPVRYSSEKLNATDLFLANLSLESARGVGASPVPFSPDLLFGVRMLCRKSSGFFSEREWRLVIPPTSVLYKERRSLTVKPRSLMLLGSSTEENRRKLQDIVSTRGIPVSLLLDDFMAPSYGKYYLMPYEL